MIQVSIVIFFFALMGIAAILKPGLVFSFFNTNAANADIRNEIRAVYGGFGLAIAGVLFWASMHPEYMKGVYLTVAVALIGMATGRVLSLVWERPGKWPFVFMGVEVILAAALFTTTA